MRQGEIKLQMRDSDIALCCAGGGCRVASAFLGSAVFRVLRVHSLRTAQLADTVRVIEVAGECSSHYCSNRYCTYYVVVQRSTDTVVYYYYTVVRIAIYKYVL